MQGSNRVLTAFGKVNGKEIGKGIFWVRCVYHFTTPRLPEVAGLEPAALRILIEVSLASLSRN